MLRLAIRQGSRSAFSLGFLGASGVTACVNTDRQRKPSACEQLHSQQAKPPLGVLQLQLPDSNASQRFCNSGDALAVSGAWTSLGKMVWHFRHGESTGNVAKHEALALDRASNTTENYMRYEKDISLADAPLTDSGIQQASAAAQQVSTWKVRPKLIVCSPLSRAIQTAAIVFAEDLAKGTARLVIRPELREFFPGIMEDQGRQLPELRACHHLRALDAWPAVAEALSAQSTAEWGSLWDSHWAKGGEGAWQAHCNDSGRLSRFNDWLSHRPETEIAVVSHWGTVNNLLNREPWAEHLARVPISKNWVPSAWPAGLAYRFDMPNCGWVAVIYEPLRER
eukprot:TRINITY_DN26976_c0_g1_i1.p1 TRINITY_DN26976_c0_g1~~TRINITY_DN26976_c0_g1_i1.p1  ORF type:complete len:338 (+),score=43.43 TRINITY_DN26976_c0_g1_i1:32-1045(+)